MFSVLAYGCLIWTLCIWVRVWGENLTTAVYPRNDYDIEKPTTLYRRSALETNAEELPKETSETSRRSRTKQPNNADIWNWDYLCQLQQKVGNCSQSHKKFYYSANVDQCVPFYYSGCNGNENNFDTEEDCTRHCKGAVQMIVKHVDKKTTCSLQPNSGLCIAIIDMWYFDVNEDTCKVFPFSGCGGNQNRFLTRSKCILKCRSEM